MALFDVIISQNLLLVTVATLCSGSSFPSAGSLSASENLVASSWGKKETDTERDVNYRLPKHVVPIKYNLGFSPNFHDNTMYGELILKIQILKSTKKITLHSNNITISSIKLKNKHNEHMRMTNFVATTDSREFLFLYFKPAVHAGNYSLYIKFTSHLPKMIRASNKTRMMVASKLQPTYARQAFPCFDEPEFKASFDITLVKPKQLIALSNMNVNSIEPSGTDKEIVKFATSMPMSTFLACFVICDFHYKEVEVQAHGIGNNFQLRTYAQKEDLYKVDFSLEIGRKTAEFYLKYFSIPFPLPKLDMIAIPDYISGATEHWGLITFRETSLLIDGDEASIMNKLNVANIIVHELAHMWFGNLVTVKWWDNLWLSEGFATYMQFKALEDIYPLWSMSDQFLTKIMHPVLAIDSKVSTHSLMQEVSTPEEITAIYDSISYYKGASILRMLEHFLGQDNFRKGIIDYLKTYQFGNADTNDFLDTLNAHFKDKATLNISHIIDTWVRQLGYPLLMVENGSDVNTYIIKQKRFFLDPEASSASKNKERWFIPITYKTSGDESEDIVWFPDKAEYVVVQLSSSDEWIKLNNNQVGFYRVSYPVSMWEKLTQQLNEKAPEFSACDRAHLLDDAFALADAREISYEIALSLTTYLIVEEEYVPWETAATIFNTLFRRLKTTKFYGKFKMYIQKLVKPVYQSIGWNTVKKDLTFGLMRRKILTLALQVDLPEAVAMARSMFLSWLNVDGTVEEIRLEPDLRDVVYNHGMKNASLAEFQKLWEIYKTETDAHEQAKLRQALAAPLDSVILKTYLKLARDELNVRKQDYLTVLQNIAANEVGSTIVWAHIRRHWPDLVSRFSLKNSYLRNLISVITADFNTQEQVTEMLAFFTKYPEAGAGESTRRSALETVRQNIRWAAHHHETFENWLDSCPLETCETTKTPVITESSSTTSSVPVITESLSTTASVPPPTTIVITTISSSITTTTPPPTSTIAFISSEQTSITTSTPLPACAIVSDTLQSSPIPTPVSSVIVSYTENSSTLPPTSAFVFVTPNTSAIASNSPENVIITPSMSPKTFLIASNFTESSFTPLMSLPISDLASNSAESSFTTASVPPPTTKKLPVPDTTKKSPVTTVKRSPITTSELYDPTITNPPPTTEFEENYIKAGLLSDRTTNLPQTTEFEETYIKPDLFRDRMLRLTPGTTIFPTIPPAPIFKVNSKFNSFWGAKFFLSTSPPPPTTRVSTTTTTTTRPRVINPPGPMYDIYANSYGNNYPSYGFNYPMYLSHPGLAGSVYNNQRGLGGPMYVRQPGLGGAYSFYRPTTPRVFFTPLYTLLHTQLKELHPTSNLQHNTVTSTSSPNLEINLIKTSTTSDHSTAWNHAPATHTTSSVASSLVETNFFKSAITSNYVTPLSHLTATEKLDEIQPNNRFSLKFNNENIHVSTDSQFNVPQSTTFTPESIILEVKKETHPLKSVSEICISQQSLPDISTEQQSLPDISTHHISKLEVPQQTMTQITTSDSTISEKEPTTSTNRDFFIDTPPIKAVDDYALTPLTLSRLNIIPKKLQDTPSHYSTVKNVSPSYDTFSKYPIPSLILDNFSLIFPSSIYSNFSYLKTSNTNFLTMPPFPSNDKAFSSSYGIVPTSPTIPSTELGAIFSSSTKTSTSYFPMPPPKPRHDKISKSKFLSVSRITTTSPRQLKTVSTKQFTPRRLTESSSSAESDSSENSSVETNSSSVETPQSSSKAIRLKTSKIALKEGKVTARRSVSPIARCSNSEVSSISRESNYSDSGSSESASTPFRYRSLLSSSKKENFFDNPLHNITATAPNTLTFYRNLNSSTEVVSTAPIRSIIPSATLPSDYSPSDITIFDTSTSSLTFLYPRPEKLENILSFHVPPTSTSQVGSAVAGLTSIASNTFSTPVVHNRSLFTTSFPESSQVAPIRKARFITVAYPIPSDLTKSGKSNRNFTETTHHISNLDKCLDNVTKSCHGNIKNSSSSYDTRSNLTSPIEFKLDLVSEHDSSMTDHSTFFLSTIRNSSKADKSRDITFITSIYENITIAPSNNNRFPTSFPPLYNDNKTEVTSDENFNSVMYSKSFSFSMPFRHAIFAVNTSVTAANSGNSSPFTVTPDKINALTTQLNTSTGSTHPGDVTSTDDPRPTSSPVVSQSELKSSVSGITTSTVSSVPTTSPHVTASFPTTKPYVANKQPFIALPAISLRPADNTSASSLTLATSYQTTSTQLIETSPELSSSTRLVETQPIETFTSLSTSPQPTNSTKTIETSLVQFTSLRPTDMQPIKTSPVLATSPLPIDAQPVNTSSVQSTSSQPSNMQPFKTSSVLSKSPRSAETQPTKTSSVPSTSLPPADTQSIETYSVLPTSPRPGDKQTIETSAPFTSPGPIDTQPLKQSIAISSPLATLTRHDYMLFDFDTTKNDMKSTTSTSLTALSKSSGSVDASLPLASLSHSDYSQFKTDATRNIIKKLSKRLSDKVRPLNYNIILNPNLDSGNFSGNIEITVDVKEEKNFIYLHSHFLNINDVKVFHHKEDVPLISFMEVKHLESLLLHFENVLKTGIYRIIIDFTGNLSRNLVGFYSSSLKDNRKMVATKFEPTYARQAFPCFDEPDFKATFDVTLVKPKNLVALSNMDVKTTLPAGTDLEIVSFATSVPMSTYLACFVICDFDYKEVEVNSYGLGKNFTLRAYAQKDQMHKIDYALYIGLKATEYYIEYYKVPFPLPKLDMIAIPDYISGATEHWGLITYRETSFLIDEEEASSLNKKSVANTICHELAHMWFGNLVTMKWWDDLWLNEGFASYMQVKVLDAIEPSWSMLDQFLTNTMHPVMVTDAKMSSHPIVQVVTTPDEITALFDDITYSKGASILRMVENFIGAEKFRHGISNYLKKHEFGNTVTQDLLSSLEKPFKDDNPGLSLTHIMDTWTRQMGYPLVTVEEASDNTLIITQKRFLLDPKAQNAKDSKYNYRWFIPITFRTNNGENPDILWFPDTAHNVTIKLDPDEAWIKINNNQVGYYRVNYPLPMWKKFIHELQKKTTDLSISDRSNLLNDAFALAEAYIVPYEMALDLSNYLILEEDYVPWYTASAVFSNLKAKLQYSDALPLLLKYVQSLLQPLYNTMHWHDAEMDIIEGLRRTQILTMATKFELPEAVVEVAKIFNGWLTAAKTSQKFVIDPDLRDIIYTYGMTNATMVQWDDLWKIYLAETDSHELTKLRKALAAPKNPKIIKRYLELAHDEKKVRSQDYLNVLQYISTNPVGAPLVWEHVVRLWPELVERYSLNSRYLGNLIPSITAYFDTQEQFDELWAFFAKYPEAGAGKAARQRAIETIRHNIAWSANHRPVIKKWLQNRKHNH